MLVSDHSQQGSWTMAGRGVHHAELQLALVIVNAVEQVTDKRDCCAATSRSCKMSYRIDGGEPRRPATPSSWLDASRPCVCVCVVQSVARTLCGKSFWNLPR